MPKRPNPPRDELPINNTVKLPESLRSRVSKAMDAGGFTVWSEFCRVALTEKCQAIERELRERDSVEFSRVYGNPGRRAED